MLLPGNVRVGNGTAPRNVAWKPGKSRASGAPVHVPARFRSVRLRRRVRIRAEGAPMAAWIVIGALLVTALVLGVPYLLG